MQVGLLDILAHEIRTPLTGILPAAMLLDSDGDMPATERRVLGRTIRESGWRLARLSEAALVVLQARFGKLNCEWSECDLGRILSRAISEVQSFDEEGDGRFVFELGEPRPLAGDVRLLRLMVESLLVSLRSTASTPARIRLAADADETVLTIATDAAYSVTSGSWGLRSVVVDGRLVGGDLSVCLTRAVAEAHGGHAEISRLPENYSIAVHLPVRR